MVHSRVGASMAVGARRSCPPMDQGREGALGFSAMPEGKQCMYEEVVRRGMLERIEYLEACKSIFGMRQELDRLRSAYAERFGGWAAGEQGGEQAVSMAVSQGMSGVPVTTVHDKEGVDQQGDADGAISTVPGKCEANSEVILADRPVEEDDHTEFYGHPIKWDTAALDLYEREWFPTIAGEGLDPADVGEKKPWEALHGNSRASGMVPADAQEVRFEQTFASEVTKHLMAMERDPFVLPGLDIGREKEQKLQAGVGLEKHVTAMERDPSVLTGLDLVDEEEQRLQAEVGMEAQGDSEKIAAIGSLLADSPCVLIVSAERIKTTCVGSKQVRARSPEFSFTSKLKKKTGAGQSDKFLQRCRGRRQQRSRR